MTSDIGILQEQMTELDKKAKTNSLLEGRIQSMTSEIVSSELEKQLAALDKRLHCNLLLEGRVQTMAAELGDVRERLAVLDRESAPAVSTRDEAIDAVRDQLVALDTKLDAGLLRVDKLREDMQEVLATLDMGLDANLRNVDEVRRELSQEAELREAGIRDLECFMMHLSELVSAAPKVSPSAASAAIPAMCSEAPLADAQDPVMFSEAASGGACESRAVVETNCAGFDALQVDGADARSAAERIAGLAERLAASLEVHDGKLDTWAQGLAELKDHLTELNRCTAGGGGGANSQCLENAIQQLSDKIVVECDERQAALASVRLEAETVVVQLSKSSTSSVKTTKLHVKADE